MLARKQELNTQLQVFIDAFLLALSLWAAYVLRYRSTFWFNLSNPIEQVIGARVRLDLDLHCPLISRTGFENSPADYPAVIMGLGAKYMRTIYIDIRNQSSFVPSRSLLMWRRLLPAFAHRKPP